jgi:hypothetical protein
LLAFETHRKDSLYCGQHEIVDMISLEGATLREIDGGNCKRDLKRAFALAEDSGTVHFMIAGSESEFEGWMETIDRAIRFYSFDSTTTNITTSGIPNLSNVSSFDDATKPDRPLGRSLAKVVNAAKVKGQAVVARGMRNSVQKTGVNSQTSDCDTRVVNDTKVERFLNSHGGTAEGTTNPTAQQIRNRLAGVGQATKSRFGSAIAAAKQKGKEAVQLRRQGASGSDWACVQCTFINSGRVWECQMCSLTRPSSDQVGSTAYSSIQFQTSSVTEKHTDDVTESLDMEEDVERQGSQIGLKNRLESVVRRARTATFEGPRSGKFNSRVNDQQQGVGATKAQKLSNISLGGLISSPKQFARSSKVQELPLKQLAGTWIVEVELQPQFPLEENIPVDSFSEKPPSNSDDVLRPEEHLEGKENVERTNPSAVTLDESGRESSSDELNQFVDLTFRIRASKHNSGTTSSECVDLIRTLSEIAALYTSLSEFIARAPILSFNQGLKRKPEASLDLSTIECMITTGKLLGGLLELPYRAESNSESIQSFYGKIR